MDAMKTKYAIPALLIPILLIPAIAPIGLVHASKPTTGSGTFTSDTVATYDFKFNGGNTYFKYDAIYTFSGPVDAILTIIGGECTIHSNGKGNCLSYGTFVGTIGGRSGTVDIVIPTTLNPDGTYQGTDISISGTGELANLKMVLFFQGILGIGSGGRTYTVQYHFDP